MSRFDTASDVSTLTANQSRVLNALLKTTSISAASEESGLSPATIKRYLADDTFASVYRKQRALILSQTLAGLVALSSKAVESLDGALDSEDPNLQFRAARAVLDDVAKLMELERRIRDQDDIEARLQALEESYAHDSNGSSAGGYRW